ncbi:MAG: hypothetical protein AAF280_09180 [Pseudomonadota bacterium]
MDEVTSFADPDSEPEIQEALSVLARGRTVITIAHRLHTAMQANQIIVLERGRLADRGQHAHLVKDGRLYVGLWSHHCALPEIPINPSAWDSAL